MLAAVRVRGSPDVRGTIGETLRQIGLPSVNNCVLLGGDESTVGRLRAVKDYVTWGELDVKGAEILLGRADTSTRKPLIEERLEDVTGYPSIGDLAEDLASGKVSLEGVGLKKTVRLHPPRKGFRDQKHSYPKGSLGYRGEGINELIRRMG